MQKKIFSKRKNKALGLCGAILAGAVIALGAAGTAKADDSLAQTAPETAQLTEAQPPAADTLIQAASTSAKQAETAASDSADLSSPSQKTAPQAAAQTAASTSAADKQETSADEKAGAVYDRVNFNDELKSVSKIAQVADVVYNGTRDEYVTVDDPSQPYQPDTAEIAKYLNQYLTELRQINGIDFPVPPVNQVMQDFAQARANEEAAESDGLEHETTLSFPQGMTWYEENGHMDNNLRRTNAAGQTIASDQATAYYLALNWFADYFNILNNPNDGLQSFGHAVSILSASGSAMGVGIADGQGGEEQSWYAELIFGGTGGTSNEQDFSSQKDTDGNWVLYYKGRPVKFLPNITFHYRTPAAKKAAPNDSQPPIAEKDSDRELPQQPDDDRTEPAAAYPIRNIPQATKPNPGNGLAAMSPAPVLTQYSPKTAKTISQAKAADLLPETGNKVSLLPAVLGMGVILMSLSFLAGRRFNR